MPNLTNQEAQTALRELLEYVRDNPDDAPGNGSNDVYDLASTFAAAVQPLINRHAEVEAESQVAYAINEGGGILDDLWNEYLDESVFGYNLYEWLAESDSTSAWTVESKQIAVGDAYYDTWDALLAAPDGRETLESLEEAKKELWASSGTWYDVRCEMLNEMDEEYDSYYDHTIVKGIRKLQSLRLAGWVAPRD